jgi:dethiobiotin synthetase
VVIVSGAGLGAINAVRSTIDALGEWEPITVVLNRYDENDELHQENYRWLINLGLDIVLSPGELAEKIIAAAR